MKLDLKIQRENFVRLDFEGKRQVVLEILESVRYTDQLFQDVYDLVSSEWAIEQDFYDVFDSLMIVLYREERDNEKNAISQLWELRDRLMQQRAREFQEVAQEKVEAENVLNVLV